jgi:hypothetical protein
MSSSSAEERDEEHVVPDVIDRLREKAPALALKRRATIPVVEAGLSSDDEDNELVDNDDLLNSAAPVTWKLRPAMKWPQRNTRALKEEFIVVNLVRNIMEMRRQPQDPKT